MNTEAPPFKETIQAEDEGMDQGVPEGNASPEANAIDED